MHFKLRVALHYSPSEERGAGDEEGADPHDEADVEGEALGAPHPRVADRPRDGQVPVDRDGAQAAYDDDDGDVIVKLDCTLTNMFSTKLKAHFSGMAPKRLE